MIDNNKVSDAGQATGAVQFSQDATDSPAPRRSLRTDRRRSYSPQTPRASSESAALSSGSFDRFVSKSAASPDDVALLVSSSSSFFKKIASQEKENIQLQKLSNSPQLTGSYQEPTPSSQGNIFPFYSPSILSKEPSRILEGTQSSPFSARFSPNQKTEYTRAFSADLIDDEGEESRVFVFQKTNQQSDGLGLDLQNAGKKKKSTKKSAKKKSKKSGDELIDLSTIKRPASVVQSIDDKIITDRIIKQKKAKRSSAIKEHGATANDIAQFAGNSIFYVAADEEHENSHILARQHGGTEAFPATRHHNSLRIVGVEHFGTQYIVKNKIKLRYSDLTELFEGNDGKPIPLIKSEKASWTDEKGSSIAVKIRGGAQDKPSSQLFEVMRLLYAHVFGPLASDQAEEQDSASKQFVSPGSVSVTALDQGMFASQKASPGSDSSSKSTRRLSFSN